MSPLALARPHRMDAKRFRSRALHEGERYGQDPFVFLRELAQNSRDAGADRIDIEFEAVGDRWRLCFRDDGAGMSFEEAKRYLFRLYASSKEGTAETA
ncbi:MAG: ATP-binding protein, partial [Myxococcota bacterium]